MAGDTAPKAQGRAIPLLPPGDYVDLPGRGRTFVRRTGPAGAPVLVLLHGLGATADLNWFPAYAALAQRYSVVAMDMRGHGRGIPTNGHPFRLDDCVGDVAALAEVLGIDRFVAVGYSMGGVVAQLLWRDHPELVEGLVLCATSRNFRGDPREKILFTIYPAAALFVRVAAPELARVAGKLLGAPGARTQWREWIRSEIALARPRAVAQAAHEVARFTSHDWATAIDVPTSVVVTARDKLVPPRRQRKLAAAIPGATLFEADGDHFVCTEYPELFLDPLEDACRSVVQRIPRWDGSSDRMAG